MLKYNFSFFFLILPLVGYSQMTYEVEADVRENSIVINKVAMEMIDDENYEKAANLMEMVIQDDPTFHPAYLNFYRAGGQVDSKKEKVIQTLREGLKIFEEDDEMSYYLGNILQRENRIQEAIKAYSDAIAYSKINGEDYPLVWAYHFNRGNCFLKSNQFKKAIPDYTYALNLSPDNPDILTNRGFCYYKTDRKPEACLDWNEAVRFGNKTTNKYLQSFCR
ncbi:tetratricopeptide repeat protein [Aquiflexum sp.]|uniref:tetratricopeptide repeat protein n=1 Tax=Aquiflexum sp. TaxID=1872584 RepID=UPI0035938770